MSRRTKIKKDVYKIEWVDAVSNHEWRSLEEILDDKEPLLRNVEYGLLLKKDKDIVIIGHGYDNDMDNVSSTLAIPRPWVKTIQKIYTDKDKGDDDDDD